VSSPTSPGRKSTVKDSALIGLNTARTPEPPLTPPRGLGPPSRVTTLGLLTLWFARFWVRWFGVGASGTWAVKDRPPLLWAVSGERRRHSPTY